MFTASLALLLLTASPASIEKDPAAQNEAQLTLIQERFVTASETANRQLILCLEPKLRLTKTLVKEFASAAEERRLEIRSDIESLERSSARCLSLSAAVQ